MIDHRLHVLRIVDETGTITAAAQVLGYTPSAVSHQLRTLSRELGVVLLEAEGRGVRLTAAATVLLRRSHDLFAHWESIQGELQQLTGEGVGRLRLAGFSTAAAALLPPVARAVTEAFPRSRVRIVEADPAVCFDLLLAQSVDVAVVVGAVGLPPSDDSRFEQTPLLEDPLDLLVPLGHRLADRPSALLEDAAEEPWIMDRRGSAHHQLVAAACLAAGFTPRQAHTVVEWDTGAALVAAGFGVSLVPRLARIPGEEDLVRVPLAGPSSPVRYVRTCVRSGTSAQPEIALALRELTVVAERVATPSSGRHAHYDGDRPAGPAPV